MAEYLSISSYQPHKIYQSKLNQTQKSGLKAQRDKHQFLDMSTFQLKKTISPKSRGINFSVRNSETVVQDQISQFLLSKPQITDKISDLINSNAGLNTTTFGLHKKQKMNNKNTKVTNVDELYYQRQKKEMNDREYHFQLKKLQYELDRSRISSGIGKTQK